METINQHPSSCSCHQNGSLTLLFLPISRHSQNIVHTEWNSASISVSSDPPAASKARVALMGNVTVFQELDGTPNRDGIETCYLAKHPDARRWLPGPKEPHIVGYAAPPLIARCVHEVFWSLGILGTFRPTCKSLAIRGATCYCVH